MTQELTPFLQKQLQASSLLKSLNKEQFARLLKACRIHTIQEGQFLFHQYDASNVFYLLSLGMVKLFRLTPNGSEKVIEIIRAGQVFAEAVMFMGAKQYPVNAVAIKDSKVISIQSSVYKDILQESPEVCFNLLGDLSQRVHRRLNEVERLSLHNATFRLVNYLLDFKKNIQQDREDIHLDVSKQIIASQLAITPETLSRILKQLSNKQLIEIHDDHIRLIDEAGLLNIIENELA